MSIQITPPALTSTSSPRGSIIWLGLLALVLSACSATVSPDKRIVQHLNTYGYGKAYAGNFLEESYATIGDTVNYLDQNHRGEISGNQKVQPDGTITVQEIGTVHVAGLTRSEIAASLSERVSLYYTDSADITVRISARPKQYFIMGEVPGEGAKTLSGELNVFDAILKARPKKNSANLGRVRLIRMDPVDPLIIPINFNDMLRGDSTYNVSIRENDIIYIPPTMLAQFAYFLDDLLFPVKQVIRGLGGAFFGNRSRNGRSSNLFF
ncbi:MAG: polysaccharide biosynthesis/export family protein [Planctomycetes bacterium]|nr:polysaccharide biosynthesis/export family protein [Planctomycetota bacterium]